MTSCIGSLHQKILYITTNRIQQTQITKNGDGNNSNSRKIRRSPLQPARVCMAAATVLLVLLVLLLLSSVLCLRCVVLCLSWDTYSPRQTGAEHGIRNLFCAVLSLGCSAVDSTACQLVIVDRWLIDWLISHNLYHIACLKLTRPPGQVLLLLS